MLGPGPSHVLMEPSPCPLIILELIRSNLMNFIHFNSSHVEELRTGAAGPASTERTAALHHTGRQRWNMPAAGRSLVNSWQIPHGGFSNRISRHFSTRCYWWPVMTTYLALQHAKCRGVSTATEWRNAILCSTCDCEGLHRWDEFSGSYKWAYGGLHEGMDRSRTTQSKLIKFNYLFALRFVRFFMKRITGEKLSFILAI